MQINIPYTLHWVQMSIVFQSIRAAPSLQLQVWNKKKEKKKYIHQYFKSKSTFTSSELSVPGSFPALTLLFLLLDFRDFGDSYNRQIKLQIIGTGYVAKRHMTLMRTDLIGNTVLGQHTHQNLVITHITCHQHLWSTALSCATLKSSL